MIEFLLLHSATLILTLQYTDIEIQNFKLSFSDNMVY